MGWLTGDSSERNTLVRGDYNCIDDLHGFKLKRSECRVRWDNALVPSEDWEERHPQDFLRSRQDRQKVPNARPEQTDVFFTSRTASELT